MVGISSRNNLDQALEYQNLLHNLQNWEHSLLDKDNKFKAHGRGDTKAVASSSKSEMGNRNKGSRREGDVAEVSKPTPFGSNDAQQYRFLAGSDTISLLSSSLLSDEAIPDANSEKELGNEYFKKKKFKEAIDCYSRSIAFSPTAVAFANRAMAFLKIKRFEDAENDCTEALNLDDRYVKAYSRRATARKELGKLKVSIEDAEFALRLDPNNQELKKQYAEVKAMYGKKFFEEASQVVKPSGGGIQVVEDQKQEVDRNVHEASSVLNSSQKLERTAVQADKQIIFNGSRKPHLNQSMQDLASRVASRASAASKNLKAPKSAYQFEVSWRGFSDNPELQASLLKTIPPPTLPQLFKNALSAPLLTDIVKCISTFFITEMDLAINFLENLTSVPRFDMIIMTLSSKDKADMKNIWNRVFSKVAIPAKVTETLNYLYPKYCP